MAILLTLFFQVLQVLIFPRWTQKSAFLISVKARGSFIVWSGALFAHPKACGLNKWFVERKRNGHFGRKYFLRSCKVIITQHINWSQVMRNKPSRKERVVYQISKFLYPLATRIIAVSTGIAEEIYQMENVNREQIICIHNPVVTLQMIELSKQQPVHPWFTQKNEPILLGVGRLTEQKDFETLIRAFHKVQSHFGCRLLILGKDQSVQN